MESDLDPKPAKGAKPRFDSSSFVARESHVPLPPPARRRTPFPSIAICVLGIAVVLGGASALWHAHKSKPLEAASASSVQIDDGVFRQKFGWFRPAGPGSLVGNGATVIIDGRNTGLHPFPAGEYGMFELEVPAGAAAQPQTAVVLVTQRYGDLMVPYTYRNTFKHTPGIREWRHVSTELSRDGGPFELQ